MAPSSDERDRGERLFCDIGGTTVALQSQDLDTIGLFVPTGQPFELDSELELRLRSPIGEMRAKAHVVQVITPTRARIENKRAGCAMVFIDLADDQRVWIGHALAATKRVVSTTIQSLRAPPHAAPAAVRAAALAPEPTPLQPSNPDQVPGARAASRVSRALTASQVSRAAPIQAPGSGLRAQVSAAAAPAPVRMVVSPGHQHWAQQRPQVRDKLRQELGAIDGKSPWEILGIGRDCDMATAKRAFLAMSKRYHPHAYARFDCPEISRMATQLFIAHKRAYSRLASTRPPPATTPTSSMPPLRVQTKPPARVDSKRPRGEEP